MVLAQAMTLVKSLVSDRYFPLDFDWNKIQFTISLSLIIIFKPLFQRNFSFN